MNQDAKNILEDENNLVSLEITTKFKPHFLIVDEILRIVILYLYLKYNFNGWWVIFANVLILIIEAVIQSRNDTVIKKYYLDVINRNPIYKGIKITLGSAVPEPVVLVSLFGGFIFSYWFIYMSIGNHEWYIHIFIFIASLIGAMFCMLPPLATEHRKTSTPIKNYKVVNKNNKTNVIHDITKYFPEFSDILPNIKRIENIQLEAVDYNDIQIAKLESGLKSINNKVDAYLLESVLLGGLAFSGFLTIVSGNILNKESTVFSFFCENVMNYFLQIKASGNIFDLKILQSYFHRNDLFILIMFLCLLSSVFFLLVLTLRIRYMSLSIEMDHLIRIMTIFNAKEEELTNIKFDGSTFHNSQENRLNKITKKVDSAISAADKLMNELNPVVTMMSACRHLAIFIFYFVLIFSGFYFSPLIAVLIFGVALLVLTFRWAETLMNVSKLKELLSSHK